MKRDKEEVEVRLTKGSKYRLTTIGTRQENLVTSGEFRGYTSIGSDEGICIKMDKSHGDLEGKTRVIPTHMILAIDLVDQKEEKEKIAREDERTAHYFG